MPERYPDLSVPEPEPESESDARGGGAASVHEARTVPTELRNTKKCNTRTKYKASS